MRHLLLLLVLLFSPPLYANRLESIFPDVIIYGSNGAFQLSVPDGWVTDSVSGIPDNLNYVLYPDGSEWLKSPEVIYARMVAPKHHYKDEFMGFMIDYLKEDDPSLTYTEVTAAKTKEGFDYTVRKYDRPHYPLYEWAAYIQLPDSVAYIVFSAKSTDLREQGWAKFESVLNSFQYRPDYKSRKQEDH